MLLKLDGVPAENLVSWCGFFNCIIRERNDVSQPFKWLEMDMR